jgi:cysteine-rich CPCC protein
MTRDEAIDILAQHDLTALSSEARESLLLDWWSIDAEDPDYEGLPELLKAELVRAEGPDSPTRPWYDSLLHIALRRSFAGVVNEFLEERLARLGIAASVDGPLEVLAGCPCCGYRSLRERGAYEICRVCFWEDDGSHDPDRVSGPNHMTLREARANFERLGAVNEAARRHVLPDGRERYMRDER